MRRNYYLALLIVLVVLLLACGKSPSNQTAEQPATTAPGSGAAAPAPGATPSLANRPASAKPGATTTAASSVPAGSHIVIRLGETITSKKNNSGDSFSGTVAEPVSVNGQVVI